MLDNLTARTPAWLSWNRIKGQLVVRRSAMGMIPPLHAASIPSIPLGQLVTLKTGRLFDYIQRRIRFQVTLLIPSSPVQDVISNAPSPASRCTHLKNV